MSLYLLHTKLTGINMPNLAGAWVIVVHIVLAILKLKLKFMQLT